MSTIASLGQMISDALTIHWKSRLLWMALTATIVVLLYPLVRYHLILLGLPGPQEYRESAIVLETDAFVSGQEPFKLKNQPLYYTAYGPLYHVILYPFAKIWGSTFFLHRLISAFFIAAILFLMLRWLYCLETSPWVAIAGAIIYYKQLLYTQTPLARPDACALFFFLLSLYIGLRPQISKGQLILALCCSLLAAALKSYFGIGGIIILAYLAVSRDWKLFRYGSLFFIASGLAIVGLQIILFPVYALTVLQHLSIGENSSFSYMIYQYKVFIRDNWILGPIILCIYYELYLNGKNKNWFSNYFLHSKHNLPLRVAFFISIIVITFKLGMHMGAFRVYHLHLLTPFLLFLIFPYFRVTTWLHGTVCILMVYYIWTVIARPIPIDPKFYAQQELLWSDLIQQRNHVLAPPPFSVILRDQYKPIYDIGMTEYAIDSVKSRLAFVLPYNVETIQSYPQKIADLIENQYFDLIIISSIDYWLINRAFLEQNYEPTYRISYVIIYNDKYDMMVWERKVRK